MINNKLFVDESPIIHSPGETKPYNINVTSEDGSTVTISTTGGSTAIYKNGTGSDLSGTHFSGAASASGSIYTTPDVTALDGGNFYICAFYATINGKVSLVGKIKLVCPRDRDDQ
jgi:hypothetical protein